MDTTQMLLTKLLEQSALFIVCGLVIRELLRMYKEEKKLVRTERKEHSLEKAALNLKKEEELKDFQKIIREQDSENRETIQKLIVTLEGLKSIISEKL